ncbi:MAG: TraX family protein [Aeromonadaceae bacterium]
MNKFQVSNEAIEWLKWFALLSMTADHVNKYLFNGTHSISFDIGRLSMPIFIIILAYNLSRPSKVINEVCCRVMAKLLMFGMISSIPFILLNNTIVPLNIMFSLFVIAAIVYLLERMSVISIVISIGIFVASGALVEYGWIGLSIGLSSYWFFKSNAWNAAAAVLIACGALWFINGNNWAVLAIPIVMLASKAPLPALPWPRTTWFFYSYYPIHLFALWLIRIPMSKAGYLFF